MRIAELTSKQFSALVKGRPLALLPIGTLEAHGMHASLATDTLIPVEIGRRVEQADPARFLLLPEIPYGHSWDLAVFDGTVDVPARAFIGYVTAVGLGLLKAGLGRQIWLNGHGGNTGALTLAAEAVAEGGGEVVVVNWWTDFRAEIDAITPGAGHAGADETAAVMAINAAWVHLEDTPEHAPPRTAKVTYKELSGRAKRFPGAVNGAPRQATAEKGETLLAMCARRVLEISAELFPN